MSEYEFSVSLRLRHPAIDPSRIMQTLGIEPQHTVSGVATPFAVLIWHPAPAIPQSPIIAV